MIRKVTPLKNFTIIEERYDNVNEIVETSKTRPMNEEYTKRGDASVLTELRQSFHGVKTVDELHNLLRFGWSDKLPELERKVAQVHKARVHKQNAIHFQTDVAGFGPIVANALMGLPKSMINFKKKPKRNKILNFLIDSTFSAHTSQSEVLEWGSKLIAELQMLEKLGYRVRIELMYCFADRFMNSKNDKAMILRYVVKHEGQPFDLKRFMFPLAHTAMFRAVGFDWEEKVPGGQARGGKGQPLYAWDDNGDNKKAIINYFKDDNYTYVSFQQSAMDKIKNSITNEEWNATRGK